MTRSSKRFTQEAKKCPLALGCRQYILFDFRIDPKGQPWFLEAGLYCSFAPKSVISCMAKAAGISLKELLMTAINETLGNNKKALKLANGIDLVLIPEK
jgi:D-alanine-D-alanine ligase